MGLSIHAQILLTAFVTAVIMGAVLNKTNFCTTGAVCDWVTSGSTGRMRAWLLAIAVSMGGLGMLEATGVVSLPLDTFPPYRTSDFAWLRFILGGAMFGVGMTLGSGCAYRTLIRIGGGNIKSIVVLAAVSLGAYAMLWTDFFNDYFLVWISPTIIDLTNHNMNSQDLAGMLGGVAGAEDVGGLRAVLGLLLAAMLLFYVFKSRDFRTSWDNIISGLGLGLAITVGWYLTAGSFAEWQEFAIFSEQPPSRVAVQSYTFIGPTGDSVRYLRDPGNFSLINFGIMAMVGVITGSFIYSLFTKGFHIEWFVSGKDFLSHVIGGGLMGVGGVLAMGCTIGQGVTGISTMALGSILAFVSIVFFCALTLKVQYGMMEGRGFFQALYQALVELRLVPTGKRIAYSLSKLKPKY